MAKNKKNKINVLNLTDVLDAYEMQKRRMSSKARSNENKDPSGAHKRPRESRRAPLEGLDLNRMCGNQRQSLGTVYSIGVVGGQISESPSLLRMHSGTSSLDMTRMDSTASEHTLGSVSRQARF